MGFVSSALTRLAPARLVFAAIFVSLAGISLLLAFIVVRRWIRSRYFARRDAVSVRIRLHWDELVSGQMPSATWTDSKLVREVMESILLDQIAIARRSELPELIECLRRSGVLDERIAQARLTRGWRKRAALIALGRTHAPEAIPALAEGLDSRDVQTRIASVRGLATAASPEAAKPLLERFVAGQLAVPWNVLKNALLTCCASDPGLLARYLHSAEQQCRELLARVLAEIADASTCDELLVMASDDSAELRGSAARGLARASQMIALPPLAQLATDPEWFVRLRAVVSLAAFVDQGAEPVLIRVLGDRNRLVRQRAAWALIRSQRLVPDVLRDAVQAGDNYGLQALVSELDRSALFEPVLQRMGQEGSYSGAIIAALHDARTRLLQSAETDTAPKPGEAVTA